MNKNLKPNDFNLCSTKLRLEAKQKAMLLKDVFELKAEYDVFDMVFDYFFAQHTNQIDTLVAEKEKQRSEVQKLRAEVLAKMKQIEA